MSRSFTAQDGRRLAFADSGGTGPAVLCLPGLTRDLGDFAALAGHLAAGYRVLRLDPRGRGESEWALDPVAEYTVAVVAGDALALLGTPPPTQTPLSARTKSY
jgi:pimeloyl-ACP methyl ester carboxylesterase